MDQILASLLNFGLGGVMAAGLLWFLYYRETVAIPRLLDRFAVELQKERDVHEKRHGEIVAELKEQRATLAVLTQSLVHVCRSAPPVRSQPSHPLLPPDRP